MTYGLELQTQLALLVSTSSTAVAYLAYLFFSPMKKKAVVAIRKRSRSGR